MYKNDLAYIDHILSCIKKIRKYVNFILYFPE